jgi:DNA polymerase IV (archaeal DinB-like DNA polymerase)
MGTRMASAGRPVILHVDMDAFYASVELKDRPDLTGKPLIVGADPRDGRMRGVVLTASYEARRFGVRSAMSCVQALRLCPDAVFVPPDFEKYAKASRGIMATLRRYGDRLEPTGIEEGYLDVTGRTGGDYRRVSELAHEIKAAIRVEHGLTCSIGAAPSKAVAKIASDFEKPDGLTIVFPEHVLEFLAPISVRKISGVGPKTGERLKEVGIELIGDLQDRPPEDLIETLGALGEYLQDVAFGRDVGEVVEPLGPPESISTETTFDSDLAGFEELWPVLEDLVRSLHAQLLEEGYAYRTVTLKVRYSDFETHTKSRSLKVHTTDLDPIMILSQMLLKDVLAAGRKLRLIGVRLSNLTERAAPQATLSKWTGIGVSPGP